MSKTRRRKKAGNLLIPLILGFAFITFIVVFAFQTWFLVDWLFPSTNIFMKIGTVGSFDVMSIVWAATDTFYGFYRWRSKHIVQAMWGITFTLATACSVIQLYLASATRLDFTLDPNIIHLSYALVILSLVGNLVALTFVFKIEWAASHPSHVEEDEDEEDADFEEDEEEFLPAPPQRTVPRMNGPRRPQGQGRLGKAWAALRGEESSSPISITPARVVEEEPEEEDEPIFTETLQGNQNGRIDQ